ncbi:MAG TPA: GC-type dockerin domain-anchored protein [Phycisphaerales bacterium]|nr:GC-type dockerin domain-anchored protein [Phycisphaerales bacterium]
MHRLAAALALASCSAALAQEYQAHIIPALSQYGIPESYLGDLNAHGVAVGTMTYTTQDANGNYHTTYHGFSWTAADGPVVHATPSGYSAINDRGDILAGGTIYFSDGATGYIEPVTGDITAGGSAINNAGAVAGTSTFRYYGGCRYARRAVMWTLSGGTVNLEAFVPSAEVGRDINDANHIVGVATYTGSCGDFEAFLYRADSDEWIDLHAMLTGGGAGITEAYAVNAIGQVVGEGWNGSCISAWFWDEDEGFTFLPALKNGDRDRVTPYDLNSAGAVVGSAAIDGWADRRAFIWDADNGVRDLNDLVELPDGFILDRAIAINEHGMIVGDGHWGPGWGPAVAFALVPAAAPCPADFNGDTVVNTLDLLAFLNAFTAGDASADFNGDTTINTLDVLAFLNVWNTGC